MNLSAQVPADDLQLNSSRIRHVVVFSCHSIILVARNARILLISG